MADETEYATNGRKRKHTEDLSNNRKLAQATRTLKACDLCRRQKTRCFKASPSATTCLRCTFLRSSCSFENDSADQATEQATEQYPLDAPADHKRLNQIHEGVDEILRILRGLRPQGESRALSEATSFHRGRPSELNGGLSLSDIPALEGPFSQKGQARTVQVSPFSIAHNQAGLNLPQPVLKLLGLAPSPPLDMSSDAVLRGTLSLASAVALVDDFRHNYGRWVLFPSSVPTDELVGRMRTRSTFLFTTCCCISLRYRNSERERALRQQLKRQLMEELQWSLVEQPHTLEFLQALVLLSIYALSFSLEDEGTHSLDPWFLSSVGLGTFTSETAFGTLDSGPTVDPGDDRSLTVVRVYNHLILVHLVSCVFSGRMCVLDEVRLNYCTAALGLLSATNFDGRMVSEIGILLTAYNYIQMALLSVEECDVHYAEVQDDTRAWKAQWEYLFSQPALQFVELCYHFCNVVIGVAYVQHRSGLQERNFAAFEDDSIASVADHADKATLAKLAHHAVLLVAFVNSIENDAYFAYLSDQIHFMFYYGGLVLVRLAKSMQDQGHPLERSVVADAQKLVDKFGRVGQGSSDVVNKYRDGLRQCLLENFGV